MNSEFNENNLIDLLPVYYKRLFPKTLFYKWLSYGNATTFENREISFTLPGDIYVRFQSFSTLEDFVQTICKRCPLKIDIGAIYNQAPSQRDNFMVPVQRELIFDIDLTDYDVIRTCCSGAGVCKKCWKFMVIACKILDAALRDDFGYKQILWVFSGRRGIHCWVADESARKLDDNQRSAVAEYLQVITGTKGPKHVNLPYTIHPSILRALAIIEKYFLNSIVIEQDILGTDQRLDAFLNMIDDDIRSSFKEAMEKVATSQERYQAFETTFRNLLNSKKIQKGSKNLIEEIKLHYSYPRLDINVSKGLNHLLKAPFCVHPKTGKVCVPFSATHADNLDPDAVPTITTIMNEINEYDEKSKEQEKELMETEDPAVFSKIKDYKKTSLLKFVNIFNDFLRNLERASAAAKSSTMEF